MKKIIFVFLLLTTAYISFSQKKELDTVRVGRELFYAPQNAFKMEVLKLLNGDILFAYERVLNYSSSVEVEIGPTISFVGFNRMSFLGVATKIPGYNLSHVREHSSNAMGFLLAVAYKKYVLENHPALNGLYVAPRLKFRNYNSFTDFSNYNSSQYINQLPDKLMNVKNNLYQGLLTFELGMNHTFKSSFGLEYYFSLGLTVNKFNYRYFSEQYHEDTFEFSYSLERGQKTFFNPNFSLGLKFYLVN